MINKEVEDKIFLFLIDVHNKNSPSSEILDKLGKEEINHYLANTLKDASPDGHIKNADEVIFAMQVLLRHGHKVLPEGDTIVAARDTIIKSFESEIATISNSYNAQHVNKEDLLFAVDADISCETIASTNKFS